MRSQAFAATTFAGAEECAAFCGLLQPGRYRAMTRPPEATAALLRKLRREYAPSLTGSLDGCCPISSYDISASFLAGELGSPMACLADARIGAAAADVAGQGRID